MRWKEGSSFEKAPTGSHPARCYALVDLGTQAHTFQGETRMSRDVRISFELPFSKMEGVYDEKQKGKPHAVHLTVKQSLHPKANLRRLLEGWRGKKFDAESIEKFDPKKLVGLPCRLNLVENGDYINVDSIAPLSAAEAKKMPKQVNAPVFVSLDPEEFDRTMFDSLHERTRAKIAASPEYKAMEGGAGEESQDSPPDDGGAPAEEDGPF